MAIDILQKSVDAYNGGRIIYASRSVGSCVHLDILKNGLADKLRISIEDGRWVVAKNENTKISTVADCASSEDQMDAALEQMIGRQLISIKLQSDSFTIKCADIELIAVCKSDFNPHGLCNWFFLTGDTTLFSVEGDGMLVEGG